jgi:hypothetical protein
VINEDAGGAKPSNPPSTHNHQLEPGEAGGADEQRELSLLYLTKS